MNRNSSVMGSTPQASAAPRSFLPSSSFVGSDFSILSDRSLAVSDVFCDNVPQGSDGNGTHELYLYLIRHGEAEHNVKEKKAINEARRASLREGLPDDHPEMQKRLELARKAALNDTTLKDAHLSDQGRREAEQARDNLQRIIADNSLPRPSYIFVSPLTRTLETCDIIFPGHDDIHVRDALSERRTGKPPDTRSSSAVLMKRPEFRHFSMEQLRVESIADMERPKSPMEAVLKESHSEVRFMGAHDTWEEFEKHNYAFYEEDKEELRKRTEYLITLLTETQSKSVACVTHKGYLRELERGPFGQPEATQFKNCEIRVYRVTLSNATGTLKTAERVK
jgi:broad specificity phosphatase PhoE